jgi:hypothetical protein
MCQLEMGFTKKSLNIVDSLIRQYTQGNNEEDLWNCYFKKGIILDRINEPE